MHARCIERRLHMNIHTYIDYIDDPNDTYEQYLEKAKKHHFRCIFAQIDTYDEAVAYLKDSGIIIAGAIDFPEGVLSLDEKMKRFQAYAEKGFKEIDYVLNQHAIETRDYAYIEKEMKTITAFCRKHGICDKAIVEMCKLDEDAKKKVCEIALRVKPAFLKTSTGKSFGGAKLEDVLLMKKILKDEVRIKAAGGIHTYEEAKALIDAGASALGASAGIAICEGEKQA